MSEEKYGHRSLRGKLRRVLARACMLRRGFFAREWNNSDFRCGDTGIFQRVARPARVDENVIGELALLAPAFPVAFRRGLPRRCQMPVPLVFAAHNFLLNRPRIDLAKHRPPAALFRFTENVARRVAVGEQCAVGVSGAIFPQPRDRAFLEPRVSREDSLPQRRAPQPLRQLEADERRVEGGHVRAGEIRVKAFREPFPRRSRKQPECARRLPRIGDERIEIAREVKRARYGVVFARADLTANPRVAVHGANFLSRGAFNRAWRKCRSHNSNAAQQPASVASAPPAASHP